MRILYSLVRNWEYRKAALLVGLLLMLSGVLLIFFAQDAANNADFLATVGVPFGVALITAGIFDLMYLAFIRSDNERILKKLIQESNSDYHSLGTVAPFRRFADSNYLKEMRSANDHIRILQTFAADNVQITDPIKEALSSNPFLRVQILLADPDAISEWLENPTQDRVNAIVQRSHDIAHIAEYDDFGRSSRSALRGADQVHSDEDPQVRAARIFRTRINESIKFITALNSSKVELRLYRSTPYFSLYQIDNFIYVGPYTLGLYAHEVPIVKFSGGMLRRCYEGHFRRLWQATSTRVVQ